MNSLLKLSDYLKNVLTLPFHDKPQELANKTSVFLTELNYITSMHYSRMRTARLLTVSQHALCRGVCIPACTGQGVVYPSMHWVGVSARGGGVSDQEGSAGGGGCL